MYDSAINIFTRQHGGISRSARTIDLRFAPNRTAFAHLRSATSITKSGKVRETKEKFAEETVGKDGDWEGRGNSASPRPDVKGAAVCRGDAAAMSTNIYLIGCLCTAANVAACVMRERSR